MPRNMLQRVLTLTLTLLFVMSAAGVGWGAATTAKPQEDAKVAIVNGQEVPRKDLEIEMNQVRKRFEKQGRTPDEAELKKTEKTIVDNLIIQALLLQEANKKKIGVDDTAVAAVFDRYSQQFPDKAKFNALLTEMGLTEEMLRDKVRQGLMIQELLKQEVEPKVQVTDEACKRFYDENPQFFQAEEQVRASHILIQVESDADEGKKKEARAKIEGIQKKVKAGEDFAELAKSSSEGPSSANGGDLGFFTRGKMVKPFSEAAFAMKTGEVSDIVETRFGYHIIKVTDRKEARTVALEEAKPKIRDSLKKQEEKNQVKIYIDDLKRQAKIERFD